MRRNGLYPPSLESVREDHEKVVREYLLAKPHKGFLVDILELDGSFLTSDPGMVFDSLSFGEKLLLVSDSEKCEYDNCTLRVYRTDGTELGQLPFAGSLIPNALLRRGVKLDVYLECRSFSAGLLSLAVSVYSEKF